MMAWLGLGAGIFFIILGLLIKNKKNNKRFDHEDYRRDFLKRNQSYNKINKNNNSLNVEDQEIKKYKKNQDDLKKINSELEELISELSAKERTLKNKIRDLNNQVLSGSKISFEQSLEQVNNKKEDNLPLKYLDAIEMHDEGLSLNEIAESLEIGVRETELIIKMYGRGKGDNG